MTVRLYLFDDERARGWEPFSLTRPVGELLFGCLLLRERAERFFGLSCAGHVTHPALATFDEPGAPPVLHPSQMRPDETRILWSSRAVPELAEPPPVDGSVQLALQGQPVGWILPPAAPMPPEAELLAPSPSGSGETIELRGSVLDEPWELVERNAERIALDAGTLFTASDTPEGVVLLGAGPLSLGAEAEIEPSVVVDTRGGPVRLEPRARALGPARLTGPLHVGPGSLILGGSVGRSSLGPACKVRGEVQASVILGYANKAHDGYLGHAYLGRWVNLGAFTTNSDLKNNYGPVRVVRPAGSVDTGLLNVGCFLGDHVKTGIGTLLNTGSVVGAGSNVFGGRMPPKYVPPFSWGAGSELVEHDLERFLETAARVMARRQVQLTEGTANLLRSAWERTRDLRTGTAPPAEKNA